MGNHFYVAGGSVFLDIEPEPGATVDKLILSIEGESFGYYEIDVPDAATSHRLVGRVLFDLDRGIRRRTVESNESGTWRQDDTTITKVAERFPIEEGMPPFDS